MRSQLYSLMDYALMVEMRRMADLADLKKTDAAIRILCGKILAAQKAAKRKRAKSAPKTGSA